MACASSLMVMVMVMVFCTCYKTPLSGQFIRLDGKRVVVFTNNRAVEGKKITNSWMVEFNFQLWHYCQFFQLVPKFLLSDRLINVLSKCDKAALLDRAIVSISSDNLTKGHAQVTEHVAVHLLTDAVYAFCLSLLQNLVSSVNVESWVQNYSTIWVVQSVSSTLLILSRYRVHRENDRCSKNWIVEYPHFQLWYVWFSWKLAVKADANML